MMSRTDRMMNSMTNRMMWIQRDGWRQVISTTAIPATSTTMAKGVMTITGSGRPENHVLDHRQHLTSASRPSTCRQAAPPFTSRSGPDERKMRAMRERKEVRRTTGPCPTEQSAIQWITTHARV